jgi:hypothetical protein
MFVRSPSGSIFKDTISQWSERISMTHISYKIYRYTQGDTFTAKLKYLSTDHERRQWFPSKPLVNSRAFHAESNRESFTSFTLGSRLQGNLLSRASVTVGRTVVAPCRTHCRSVCLLRQRTGLPARTACVTRIQYRKNILVNATFQLRPKYSTSHEKWRKHFLFWMKEVNIVDSCPMLQQRKCVCQIGAVSQKIFVNTVP